MSKGGRPSRSGKSRGNPAKLSVAEERARAQEAARVRREQQSVALRAHFAEEDTPGAWLVRLQVISTTVFGVVSFTAVIADTRPTRVAAAAIDLVLFGIGLVLFVLALAWGADRSRRSEMTMAGWWFLGGAAPKNVRAILLGALAAQTVIALVTAAILPFTALAFGVLVPTLGIAVCGAWSARYGYFPDRANGGRQR